MSGSQVIILLDPNDLEEFFVLFRGHGISIYLKWCFLLQTPINIILPVFNFLSFHSLTRKSVI